MLLYNHDTHITSHKIKFVKQGVIRRGYDLSRCLALHFFHEAVLEVIINYRF